MDNVAVVVEDSPLPELLAEMGIVPPDTLYGLYQGVPLPEREWAHGQRAPRPDHALPAPDWWKTAMTMTRSSTSSVTTSVSVRLGSRKSSPDIGAARIDADDQ